MPENVIKCWKYFVTVCTEVEYDPSYYEILKGLNDTS